MPAPTPTKHVPAGTPSQAPQKGAETAFRTVPDKNPEPLATRLLEHLHLHGVGAHRGQPDVLGRSLREIQSFPTT